MKCGILIASLAGSALVASSAGAGIATVIPTLTTTAAAKGAALSDTAHLSGGLLPGGTITFRLYGPNDATCGNPAIDSETVSVAGNGDYPSDAFVVSAAGTYRFTAEYSGDSSNLGVKPVCNLPDESLDVVAVTPTLTSTASPNGPVSAFFSDTAHLSGGNSPTGNLHFQFFGPDDATCGNPAVFQETIDVSGNGDVESDSASVSAPGTYRWTVDYSGDGANNPVSAPCNASGESVVVGGEPPAPQVPTLAPIALALLAALVAGSGAWISRG